MSLKLRPLPLQVFISIEVIGKRIGVRGNLSYLRTLEKGYDYKKGDDLDNEIFKEIEKHPFEDTHPPKRALLLYEEQFLAIKKSIDWPYKQKFDLLICGCMTVDAFKKNPTQLCQPVGLRLRYFHTKENREIIDSYMAGLGMIVYLNTPNPLKISQSIIAV